MCEQCVTEALFLGEPLPGVYFVRAKRDGALMDKGDYGLVFCNDPFMTFATKPYPDPLHGLSDDEINTLSLEEVQPGLQWGEAMREFYLELNVTMDNAWRLIEIARQTPTDPYDPSEEGLFASWLFHRLGVFLESGEKPE